MGSWHIPQCEWEAAVKSTKFEQSRDLNFYGSITCMGEGFCGCFSVDYVPFPHLRIYCMATKRNARTQASRLSLALSKVGVWFAHNHVHSCISSSVQPCESCWDSSLQMKKLRLREVVICLGSPQHWCKGGFGVRFFLFLCPAMYHATTAVTANIAEGVGCLWLF